MEEEVWLPINAWERHYKISSLGKVVSLPKYKKGHKSWYWTKEKELIPCKAQMSDDPEDYYVFVVLCYNGRKEIKLIHRLVADHFIPNPENKPDVNHLDGVKYHNWKPNLEWATEVENQAHAITNGLVPRQKEGVDSKYAKPIAMIGSDGAIIKAFGAAIEAERLGGYCRRAIGMAANGVNKTAFGYKWKFITKEEFKLFQQIKNSDAKSK